VNDDVQCGRPEITRQARGEAVDGEVAELAIPFVLPDVLRRFSERVERGIEVDLLELRSFPLLSRRDSSSFPARAES
jgi:hypothetical protein